MNWQRELDELIASTMALAKDVRPKPISDLAPVVRAAEQSLADTRSIPSAVTAMAWPKSERDEILQRVSNFRAHQEKITREREHYYSQVKANMLAGIDNPVQSK